MKLNKDIQHRLLNHYHLNDYLLIELDASGLVLDYQGNLLLLPNIKVKQLIQDHILALATETFESDFSIPFYHLTDQKVVDLHHFCIEGCHHLILLPQDQVYRETQLKQQVALEAQIHNQTLTNMLNVLQQTQDQLQQANQDKSFLLSALSHEMGTPLNSIQGHAEMAIQDPNTTAQALQVIIKNSQQLQHIIKQTLNIDRDQSQDDKQNFDLLELLTELKDNLLPLASFKGLTFDVSCATGIKLYSNRSQWQQILTNLITNAIKYTQHGGININVHTQAQCLTIDVIDTGIGISPAFQQQLFKTWQREHKDQAKGSGIGLAIAKMLAEGLGLKLELQNTSKQGSTFRLTHAAFQHHTQHVLLIEDDEDLRRLFAYFLQQMDLKVTQAGSWQEIHDQFALQNFDAILTDRHLQDGLADEQLNTLRDMAQQVLVMTGNPNQKTVSELLSLGFDQVLSKPLSKNQIGKALFGS